MPFHFKGLDIPGLVLAEPKVFPDERGFFAETYKYSEFAANGIEDHFVQDNHSRSTKGVLRGLHYQKRPKAQGKLVRVVIGEIFDVAVDIRQGSPTCGKWVGVLLSAENMRMLYVPPWCAHGFCVVSEVAEVVYKTTEEYSPESEAGVIWNDPDIGVSWPIQQPIVSAKDASFPTLKEAGSPFVYSDQPK